MNTRLTSVLLLAAALNAFASSPVSAASKNDQPAAFHVHTLIATVTGGEQIERGTSRADAHYALKSKQIQELSPNVWAIAGYHGDLDLAEDHDCHTLIVWFAHNKVVDLQLVNTPAAGIIAQNVKRSPAGNAIASK